VAKAKRKPIIDVEQERALLSKARDGDKRAMERLISVHYPAMYHLALRYTRDPERALDATQESCVQVLRHLGQFRSEARFSSWMARIVINSARLRYRSDKRLVPMADGIWMDSVSKTPSPEDMTAGRELLQQVDQVLQNGREGDYNLFLKRFVDGESVKNISEQTGVSVPAIKTRVHRARNRLKSTFNATLPHPA
jgi:RNA polymerase sigma-70 factor (ECF subfamily)